MDLFFEVEASTEEPLGGFGVGEREELQEGGGWPHGAGGGGIVGFRDGVRHIIGEEAVRHGFGFAEFATEAELSW